MYFIILPLYKFKPTAVKVFESFTVSRKSFSNCQRLLFKRNHQSSYKVENYQRQAAQTLQDAWDLFHRKDWKLVRQNGLDAVYCRVDSTGSKIYKLQAQLEVAPKFVLDELYFRFQDQFRWNGAVKESHKIQALDEHTDITYIVSEDFAGGLVSSRDFVSLRHWAQVEDCYVIASVKTEHSSLPVFKKFVRGENGTGGQIMQTVPETPNKCNFVWIVNTNLKIWLPGAIIDREMASTLFGYLKDLRQHMVRKGQVATHD